MCDSLYHTQRRATGKQGREDIIMKSLFVTKQDVEPSDMMGQSNLSGLDSAGKPVENIAFALFGAEIRWDI